MCVCGGLDASTSVVAAVWVCAHRTPKYHFEVPGELLNTNTIESFHALDKKKQLDLVAAKVPSPPSRLLSAIHLHHCGGDCCCCCVGRLKPPTKNFVEVSSADEKELLMTCVRLSS